MSTTPGVTLAARAAVGPVGAVPADGDPPPEKGLVGLDGATGAGLEGAAGTDGEAVLRVGRAPCQRHRLTTPAKAPTTSEAARAAASADRPHRAGGAGGGAGGRGGGPSDGGGGAAQGGGTATHSGQG